MFVILARSMAPTNPCVERARSARKCLWSTSGGLENGRLGLHFAFQIDPKSPPRAFWASWEHLGASWGVPGSLLGRSQDDPGTLWGAPWKLQALPWELLGHFWVRFGVLWGSPGTLLGCFSGFGGRATAKTPKTLNLMTLLQDLLRFKGPKASKIRSKCSLRLEKREEKREKSREEREESAIEAKSDRSS